MWLCAALMGCDSSDPPPRPPIEGSVSSFATARRPEQTIFVESAGNRCEVFWTSPTHESVRKEIRCPRELEPGERMRLTGRTCHRESPTPERRGPTRCASSLLSVEKALAERKGEFYLRARNPKP